MNKKIKIAIVGIGNCASSLIQGIYFYKNKKNIPGLLHDKIGNYKIDDIEIVTAFDIDERKTGKDISEAIFQKPNNTKILFKEIPKTGIKVLRGPTLDGFPKHMEKFPEEDRFKESKEKAVDAAKILKQTKPDLLINYLPVGSKKATKYYVDSCLKANVSFINAIPVFICSEEKYINKFKVKNLVCLGDDIKSQIGATIVHRVLTNLFVKRGVKLNRTYQLNFGGNTDFLNMLDRNRLETKKISKTGAVQSQLKSQLSSKNIHIGPSDYIPWLKDNKICQIRMEGEQFGGNILEIDLKLSVEDSPNSAGVMIDAIRCAKIALDKKISGYLEEISAFAFKHPKTQFTDDESFMRIEEFIQKNG